MAVLVYDGSAKDHSVKPQLLAKGEDGRPAKRKVVRPAETEFFPIDTYDLWGVKFPKGEEVEVPHSLVVKGIVKKAKALGCFKVFEVPLQIEVRDENTDIAPVEIEKPKRGRPRKAEVTSVTE